MKGWLTTWHVYRYHMERHEQATNDYARAPYQCPIAWEKVQKWRESVHYWRKGIYFAGEKPGGGFVAFVIRGKLYGGKVADSAAIMRDAPAKGSCGKLFNKLKVAGVVFERMDKPVQQDLFD